MSPYRIRVRRGRDGWLWLCTCSDGRFVDSQPDALAAGLAHLELWHNDPAARRPA